MACPSAVVGLVVLSLLLVEALRISPVAKPAVAAAKPRAVASVKAVVQILRYMMNVPFEWLVSVGVLGGGAETMEIPGWLNWPGTIWGWLSLWLSVRAVRPQFLVPDLAVVVSQCGGLQLRG